MENYEIRRGIVLAVENHVSVPLCPPHVLPVVDILAVGQVFLRVVRFSTASTIPQVLNIHSYMSAIDSVVMYSAVRIFSHS